jgi:hypothetical protein
MADLIKGYRKYVSSLQKPESIVGEYMPKNLREQQVSEIRGSHFVLGYEPTKPNMVTTSNAVAENFG